jgi:hypothetical protein
MGRNRKKMEIAEKIQKRTGIAEKIRKKTKIQEKIPKEIQKNRSFFVLSYDLRCISEHAP